jgi:hypothetical protein
MHDDGATDATKDSSDRNAAKPRLIQQCRRCEIVSTAEYYFCYTAVSLMIEIISKLRMTKRRAQTRRMTHLQNYDIAIITIKIII